MNGRSPAGSATSSAAGGGGGGGRRSGGPGADRRAQPRPRRRARQPRRRRGARARRRHPARALGDRRRRRATWSAHGITSSRSRRPTRSGPPWGSRPEVREALAGRRAFGRHLTPGGEALLITLAEPTADGGVLYFVSGVVPGDPAARHRAAPARSAPHLRAGAGAAAGDLVRVQPGAAARAPGGRCAPLSGGAAGRRRVAARRDEIGALSRTLARMADDLDARRRGAADLGADIAHEFKNPLASIAASAELLSSGAPPTAERLALATTTIAGSVERLRRSIDELLRLLRMEDAMAHEARPPVVVGRPPARAGRRISPRPRYAGWRFDVAVDAGAEAIATPLDRARFAEMLRNLADNALVQPAAERRLVLRAPSARAASSSFPSATTAPASRARTRRASSAVSSRSARPAPPGDRPRPLESSTASRARTAGGSRSPPSRARARSSASFFLCRSDVHGRARRHRFATTSPRLIHGWFNGRSPPSTTVVLGGCP